MFNFFKPKVYNSGYLPEYEGHSIYYMQLGNPQGQPVLVFHGGPGGSAKISQARFFNRRKYRIILFDQRGCGRSLPSGELQNNDLFKILDDADRLLDYLNIKGKILLRGGSWGATLALMYAIRHPQKVAKMLLSQIFLANQKNQNWLEKGSGAFYPDILSQLYVGVSPEKTLAQNYAMMINSDDFVQQTQAVNLYGNYELVLGRLCPRLDTRSPSPEDIASARIYINYAARNFMLTDNYILDNSQVLSDIPILIVHNRLDMVCPLQGAYELHRHLPLSKLVIVPDIGHCSSKLYKTLQKEIKSFVA